MGYKRKRNRKERRKGGERGKNKIREKWESNIAAQPPAQNGSSRRCHSSQTLSCISSLSCNLAVIFSISSTSFNLAYRVAWEGGERRFQLRATRQRAAVRMCLSSCLYGLAICSGDIYKAGRISASWGSVPQRGRPVSAAL